MKSTKIKSKILAIPRQIKRIIVIKVECAFAIFAVWLAYYLRIGEFVPLFEKYNEHYALPSCILAIVIFLPIFISYRLYDEVFHFSSNKTLATIIKALIIYATIYSAIFTIYGVDGVPRTIGIIQPLAFMLLILCTRFFGFFWLSNINTNLLKQNEIKRALIYGANEDGRELMIALSNNSEINIVGFLDDDPKLHKSNIDMLKVYNPIDVKNIIAKKKINEIFLVSKKVNRYRRRQIVNLLSTENVTIRNLPSYTDLAQGRITINDINKLSVEDILGRDPVKPDPKLMKHDITNKIVLVTGAGGSIGREISKQIYYQKPKKLILVDQNELSLYKLSEKFAKISNLNNSHIDIRPVLASITDKIIIKEIFNKMKPDTIFHAAAYKHVPIVQRNIFTALTNNVIGTLVLAELAIVAGVKKFILISSDKAVRPKNVMGASKRLAEMILQALSVKQKITAFGIVRFGNVLNSSGSVVPLFKSQIVSGGPVTVTHPNITRYFMTIYEAAELVIQAAAISEDHKKTERSSPIFILDMGEPIKIYDLAKVMINLSGLSVYDKITQKGDIEIKFIGIRKGEKLHEELLIGNSVKSTTHPKIKYADEEFLDWSLLSKHLFKISEAMAVSNQKLVKQYLEELIPGFKIAK